MSLRDYKHASKIFRDANFRLSPKTGAIFHVAFDFGTEIGFGEQNASERIEAGLLVKKVDLPSFKINTAVQNAYNRKNIIQSKIEYGEVKIVFHDDSANLTNSIWQAYYEYYYGDSYGEESSYSLNTKYNDRTRVDWGYLPQTKPFFKSIRIYSLSQNKFTGYTLINPLITSWNHGNHDTSSDELMENQMSVQYETLLYSHGIVGEDDEPKFFTDMHYDNEVSPLGLDYGDGPPTSVVASGGSIRAGNSIVDAFLGGDFSGGLLDAALNGDKEGLKDALTGNAKNFGKGIISGDDVSGRYNFPDGVTNSIGTFQDKTKVIRAAENITGNVNVGTRDAAQAATSNNATIAIQPTSSPNLISIK